MEEMKCWAMCWVLNEKTRLMLLNVFFKFRSQNWRGKLCVCKFKSSKVRLIIILYIWSKLELYMGWVFIIVFFLYLKLFYGSFFGFFLGRLFQLQFLLGLKHSCLVLVTSTNSLSKYGDMWLFFPQNMANFTVFPLRKKLF